MRSGKIESVAATASRAALGAQDGMLQGTVLAGTAASGYFSRASQRGRSLGARDGRGATYDWTVVTTRTEVLAEGRPRTLGRRRPLRHPPIEIVTDRKNAVFGERYLRMNERAVYQLGPTCETCPPLFRQLSEAPAPALVSKAELKDRLAGGLGSLDEDVLAVMSSVLPVGEYVPLLLRLWPRLVVPGEPGDYFAEERLVAFPDVEVWDRGTQPSGPYYRGTAVHLSESAELFEFVLPLVAVPSLNPERVHHYQTLIEGGSSPTALAVSVLDGSVGDDTDLPVMPVHWALGHFLLDGHHKIQAAAQLKAPLTLMALLSTTMGKARSETVLQLVCELAGRRWAGPDLLGRR
jgi:hypothetical protein